MQLFTSERERRLWLLAGAVVVAIYSTLGLASTLAAALRDRGLISTGFWLGLFLVGAAIVIQGLRVRPRGVEIGIMVGVAGAYLIAFLRMSSPEERSHLVEYTIVALIIYEALKERANNGRRVPRPAVLAIAFTALLGWIDEGIQIFLPSRVFDMLDVGTNALAAFMAVSASALLTWVRRRIDPPPSQQVR